MHVCFLIYNGAREIKYEGGVVCMDILKGQFNVFFVKCPESNHMEWPIQAQQ